MSAGIISSMLRGAIAGCVATIPMTATMLAIHRRLPWKDRGHLPPRQITTEFTEVIGVKRLLEEHHHDVLTLASHFGYGTGMGALYGPAIGDRGGSPVAKGVAFGLGVWAASYLGWLPAAQFRAAADRQGTNRNAMMIAAHVVWGASLGLLDQHLSTSKDPATARLKASAHLYHPRN